MRLFNQLKSSFQDFYGQRDSLRRDTVEGMMWTSGASVVGRIVSFLKTIVLARLLVSDDFGLFGIAVATFAALQVFTETGTKSLLVQKPDVDERYWNTGWSIQMVRGVVLCAALWAVSGILARFYDLPALGPVLRVMALAYLLEGFGNIALVQLQRHMRFKTSVSILQLADLLGSLAAITVGFILRSYWALVAGKVFSSFCILVTSYIFLSHRPRLRFDRSAAKDFLSFGLPLFVVAVAVYVITSVDDMVVGKVLGISVLGYYAMAYSLASYPTYHVSRTVARVAFPAYARLQEDRERLQSGFLSVFFYTSAAVAPLSIGLAILAQGFTLVVLGEKWLPIVTALQILCFQGLFRSIASIMGPLIIGSGRPDYLRNAKLLELAIFVPLIYPVVRYGGLVGVCFFTTALYALSLGQHIYLGRRIMPTYLPSFFRIAFRLCTSTAVMAIVVLIAKQFLFEETTVAGLIALVITGAAVYLPLAYMMYRRFSTENGSRAPE